MSLSIYLNFNGNCREVFDYYKSIFGGEFAEFQTFGDAPPDIAATAADKDRVMHVSLPVGSSTLMGSDIPSDEDEPLVTGSNFSITVAGDSKQHCDELFDKLAAGGAIKMPLEETFWGAYFGMCRDRYGINWMFNYDMQQD